MNLITRGVVAGAFAVAASGISAFGANAATILFDFEDANNGAGTYYSQGYVFDPINLNSSQHCADDGGTPLHCFLEVTNGTPTALYAGNEVPNTTTQNPNDTMPSATNTFFDLLGFYFNFQGTAPNSLKLYTQAGSNTLPYTTIALGASYTGTGDFAIYSADSTPYTGELLQNTGYFVIFNNNLFDDIKTFSFNAVEDKQIRIDCVVISDTNDNIGIGGFGNCSGDLPQVPVPAAGFLLIGALGGLVGLRRFRKA